MIGGASRPGRVSFRVGNFSSADDADNAVLRLRYAFTNMQWARREKNLRYPRHLRMKNYLYAERKPCSSATLAFF